MILSVLAGLIVSHTIFASADVTTSYRHAGKPDTWFQSENGRRVAENILAWQSPQGLWPKNGDTTVPCTVEKKELRGTYDNSATYEEMRFLARAYNVAPDSRYKEAVVRALDNILAAQYPNGGWPQYHPSGDGYPRYITFNDDAMVNIMYLLNDIAESNEFAFVDKKRRKKAATAFDKGIKCMLDCQISVDGKLTAWCAQHDEKTLEPRLARSYEHPSISGMESVPIVMLLMTHGDVSDPRVLDSINSACEWFESAKITGLRLFEIQVESGENEENEDRWVVPDPDAPPLWGRFYEIDTNRAIFSGRDGVIKHTLAEIEQERRGGYRWYGFWPVEALDEWPKWKKKHGTSK
jgi:PelA/Pel-15E family pectate lyase